MKILSIKTNTSFGRNQLIDFLRGGATFLVLLQHAAFPMGHYILAFHMPLFFMISGYLEYTTGKLQASSFKTFLKKKFLRYIVPYFAFETINLLLWILRCLIEHEQLPGIESITAILTCTNQSFTGLYGRLWFLPCLFFAEIYVWLILKWFKNNRFAQILSILGLFSLSFITTRLPFKLFFTVDTAFFAAAFIMIGFCFGNAINVLLQKGNDIAKIVLACFGLGFLVYAHLDTGAYVYMYINSYGEYTVSICGAVFGCIAFFIIGEYLYRIIKRIALINNFVLWYGNNSLATFPVHLAIKAFILWYVPVLSPWYFLFPVMMILNVPIVNLITNYLPFFLGRWYTRSEKKKATISQ